MHAYCFIFLLSLSACKSSYTEQLPEILQRLEQQRIRMLLQSEEAALAYKKELITASEKQNKIRTAVLVIGILTIVSSLFPKHICEQIYRVGETTYRDEFIAEDVSHIPLYATLTKTVGFIIMGIGACLPYKDTESLQKEIDNNQENIKRWKVMLAPLQIKAEDQKENQ